MAMTDDDTEIVVTIKKSGREVTCSRGLITGATSMASIDFVTTTANNLAAEAWAVHVVKAESPVKIVIEDIEPDVGHPDQPRLLGQSKHGPPLSPSWTPSWCD